MEKNRIEAFSDGVFAIAITLLILEIKLPHDVDDLGQALADMGPKILIWLFSFMIVGMYWVAHHSMLHFQKRIDRNALWINNLTLAAVAFLSWQASLVLIALVPAFFILPNPLAKRLLGPA